jgi:hypothetical protein
VIEGKVEKIRINEEPEGSPLRKKKLDDSPVRISSVVCARGSPVSLYRGN